MARQLIIIGAGGFGREVLSWVLQVPSEDRYWEVAGFLDDNPLALEGFGLNVGIMASVDGYSVKEDDLFICAIADPQVKLQILGSIKERGGSFLTFIHPTAIVGQGVQIDEGSILCPYSVVTTQSNLGKAVVLNVAATVGHDVTVGDGCTLSAHSDVTGNARLGAGVFLGSHAVVLPSVNVGEGTFVGAGSVVLKDTPANVKVFGVPAVAYEQAKHHKV